MKTPRLFQIAPLVLILAAGCGQKPAAQPTEGHPLPNPRVVSGDPGKPGGQFTIVAPGVPQRFNPMLAQDAASDEVVRLLFGTLVIMDETTQTPQPGLAESWSVSPDGLTWTFKLRAGLHWSDGEPLTADDVVFTWNNVMYDRDLNNVSYGVFVADGRPFTVSKVDDLTVQVVTPAVYAPFLDFFGQVDILPKHKMEIPARQHNFLSVYTLDTPPQRIACSGPYRVKSVGAGQVLLERNPEYWSADRTGRRLPYFDQVKIQPGSAEAGASSFLQGAGDVYELSHPQEYDEFVQAATNGNFKVVDLGMGTERDFLWFNENTGINAAGQPVVKPELVKWFRNTKFRQAVSCALDRDRMVRDVYHGRAQIVYGVVAAENTRWDNPNIPHYAYDLARAKSLLADIGLVDRKGDGMVEDADGNTVDFTVESNEGNPLRSQCAEQVVEDLKKIGLNAHLKLSDYHDLGWRVQVSGNYECALMGLAGGGTEPAAQMQLLKSDQPMHQWFPNQARPSTDWEARIDELMDGQMRTLDFGERKKKFDEVQAILAEQLPMISTVAAWQFAAVRTNVTNLRPSVTTAYHLTWNLDELYFSSPAISGAAPIAPQLSQ